MGCAGSKLEEHDAVARCRGRSELLAEAIHHRYALADAHAAYADSLCSVGAALHRFLDSSHGAYLQGLPILSLPAQRKGGSTHPLPPPVAPLAESIPSVHSRSRSHSGSHIHFHSSDDSETEDDSLLHSDSDFPIRLHFDHHELAARGPTYINLHHTRNDPLPLSVSFEQRVEIPERVHHGSVAVPPSSSSYPFPFPYPYQTNYLGYAGMGDFFSSSSPPAVMSQPAPVGPESNSKPYTSVTAAPPPPSPPRASTWDFLNPFESFESYYRSYTSSRSSKELVKDEVTPDLEDDKQEVIKEAYGDPNLIASATSTSSKGASVAGEDVHSSSEDSQYDLRSKEDEVEALEKNVVGGETQKTHEERGTVVAPRQYGDISEIAGDIRIQFDRASESAKELAMVLEVGKRPYVRRSPVYTVSSRMMCVFPVSFSKSEDLEYEGDKAMRTANLSSTLEKLYIWERKLHDEVKVVEKIRLLHDRTKKKLQQLDERGAEAHKIEVTQTFLRKLSTNIRISIQIVNSITTKINALRDEELWPQIQELIEGMEKMWRVILECHQIQSQAIHEADHLASISFTGKANDELMNATMHLAMELQRWIENFSAWINSQKSFIKSLNSWLTLCLCYEPEITTDGIPPYSPGKVGAPPVFVIVNCWSQALDRASESEIMAAMQSASAIIKQLGQQNDTHLRVIDREADALNKTLVVVAASNNLSLSQSDELGSLQSALSQLFLSMENFAFNAMKAYEDLHARVIEEKVEPNDSSV